MVSQQLSSIKSMILRAVGPSNAGRIDYFFRPSLRSSWGGPLNAQLGRANLCREIFSSQRPTVIVETGTFRGTTTKFFAEFRVPVYTVEADPRYYTYAKLNTRKVRNRVKLTLSDSRTFLSRLTSDSSFSRDRAFFYLDAHWDADLPLAEEIDIIFSTCTRSIIMIDDFEVPGDSYDYDDYGAGSALNADYLDGIGRTDMYRLYPSLPANRETGMRRGCIVLCNDMETRDRLGELESLRSA